MLSIKKSKNEIKTRLMDIKDQKDTWNGFTKLAIIAGVMIVLILVMMAFFSLDTKLSIIKYYRGSFYIILNLCLELFS